MSLKAVLKEAPSVTDIVASGGRMEIRHGNDTYFINVKVGLAEGSRMYRNFEWLHEHYVQEDMTMQEIADMFGVAPMTIQLWLNKHEIETRPRGRREIQ